MSNPLYKASLKCYIEFTGFGDGGGKFYAVFAALRYAKRFKVKPIVVTFGQPRMGDTYFAYIVSTYLQMYRVTYADDYIPAFPFGNKDLWPLSTEYWIPKQEQCDCTFDITLPDQSNFPVVFRCEQRGTQSLNKVGGSGGGVGGGDVSDFDKT
ncbi:hypothetical protein G9A89_009210 [Geosiphon pyriformis]|nr:hypothetical protein G9A89_009210 [Geosiphon pyriformis]